ncbi:hypothetical protein MMC22_006780 [Lobaria immixta]|nr:hypothetical protein [Lobaria immixta]
MLGQNFSDTSIARGTLVISFYLCGIDLPPLKKYMLWLSMLTSFRTIEVLFFDFEGHSLSPVFEYIKPILESKLGDAEYFRPEGKVRMDGWYPEDGRVDTHGKHSEDKDGWYTEDEDGELSGDEDGERSGDEDGECSGDEDGERSGDENGEHTEVENGEHTEVENGEHTKVENGEHTEVENGERSGDENGEHTKVERAEGDEDGLKYRGEVFEAGLRFHPRNHQNLDGSSQPES